MDIILDKFDSCLFNHVYANFSIERNNIIRQLISINIIVTTSIYVLYLIFGLLDFLFIFDYAEWKKNPRVFPNQIRDEILMSIRSIPYMVALSSPIFVAQIRGYSKIHSEFNIINMLISTVGFIVVSDTCLYWTHRLSHTIKIAYKYIHKPHHKWVIPSPFASFAFTPIDGFIQSIPYLFYSFVFPMNKYVYIVLYLGIFIWATSVHDSKAFLENPILCNGKDHAIHHTKFLYNYGQYTTFWDRIMGTYKEPSEI